MPHFTYSQNGGYYFNNENNNNKKNPPNYLPGGVLIAIIYTILLKVYNLVS